jgi:hypothetical protein
MSEKLARASHVTPVSGATVGVLMIFVAKEKHTH